MQVLRKSQVKRLDSFSGERSLATANRHDMCHPETLVEFPSIPIGEGNGPAGGITREEFSVPCCYIEKAAGMNQRSLLAGKSIIQGDGSIDGTGQDDRPPRR